MNTTPTETGRISRTEFDGDFSFLPFRAHVEYGELPLYPIAGEFEIAVSQVVHNPDDPAAHWRVEAIRFRRANPGKPMDAAAQKAINLKTAERLYARSMEVLSAE